MRGGEGKKKVEGEDREQLGDRQKNRQLNSIGSDSCLLCAGAGCMDKATAQPCLRGFCIPDKNGRERGWKRRGRIREKGQG